jgi:hypothetical protein
MRAERTLRNRETLPRRVRFGPGFALPGCGDPETELATRLAGPLLGCELALGGTHETGPTYLWWTVVGRNRVQYR